jgi:hypothetical protein
MFGLNPAFLHTARMSNPKSYVENAPIDYKMRPIFQDTSFRSGQFCSGSEIACEFNILTGGENVAFSECKIPLYVQFPAFVNTSHTNHSRRTENDKDNRNDIVSMLDGFVSMLPSKELCSAIGRFIPRATKEMTKKKMPKDLIPEGSVLEGIYDSDDDDKVEDVTEKQIFSANSRK